MDHQIDPFESRIFGGFEAAPRPKSVDHLGLVEVIARDAQIGRTAQFDHRNVDGDERIGAPAQREKYRWLQV